MNRIHPILAALLLLCLCAAPARPALSKAAMEQTKGMMKNVCKNKSGVKPNLLAGMKKGEFPEDRKLMCYLSCCAGMMQVIKKDKLNVDSALKQIEKMLPDEMKPTAIKQLEACKTVDGADGCELGYNLAKCCYEAAPNDFLFPT